MTAIISIIFILIPFCVCDFGLFMPHVRTDREIVLCYSVKIDNEVFIAGFDPMVEQAAHILIFTCYVPGYHNRTWECEPTSEEEENHLQDICSDDRKRILYSWANNGKGIRLPKDISFRVGGENNPNFLVINAHYHGPIEIPDSSGIWFITTQNTPNSAGVLLLHATRGAVPPGESTISVECIYENEITLHPILYRVHTHDIGVMVSGFRTHRGSIAALGQRDPRLPQTFEPTISKITIEKNDIINSVCKMINNGDRNVSIGLSHHSEMCFYYLIYWVEGTTLPSPDSFITSEKIDVIQENYRYNGNLKGHHRRNKKQRLLKKIKKMWK